MSEKLPGYPMNVRFNDLDSYGVVNNAVYLTYFEEARMQWFSDKLNVDWNWKKQGIIIARHEIDYKLPIFLEDKPRMIMWISEIGEKSFEVCYRVIKKLKDKWVVSTEGKSVIVCFDYTLQKSIPVPDSWRELFQNYKEAEDY
jgi:acyl-CoA thioester hydrolase